MGLVISRKKDESYYLILCKPLKTGDCIKILKGFIDYEYGVLKVRDFIEAPEEIIILREEHIKERGGLEKVINKIKLGGVYKKGNKYILLDINENLVSYGKT